jgi:hypothetical protein
MTSRLIGIARRNKPTFAILRALALALYLLAQATLAQDPIRVESNEVLVPVFVFDKEQVRLLQRGIPKALTEDPTVIRGLTATDFHIFEDEKEESIQNVSFEVIPTYEVHDNRGYHSEFIGEGGGKWSTREWPPWLVGNAETRYYVVAYTPRESPEGSCHQVRVTVNRRNALIIARSEYCNTKHSPFDPLNGTEFGKQLERNLASLNGSNIDVSLLTVPFYMENHPARVHIAVDWPWKSLKSKADTVGILGIVSGKGGSLVTRFSDVCEIDDLCRHNSTVEGFGVPQWDHVLTRYETQLILPPGEYDLRVVLSDGTRFGRAQTSLAVDAFDGKELAISAVSLCKQIQDVSAYSSRNPARLPGVWVAKLPRNYVPLVSDDIEFKPTGNTRFKKNETLYTYFEVYEPLLVAEPSTTVDFRVHIIDLKTGEVRSDSPTVSATPYVKAGSSVIPIGRRTNIRNLPKGSYRLDVQATDSAGKTTPWRSVNFTVE